MGAASFSAERVTHPPIRIRVATDAWEVEGCYALRHAVFCDEQRIFERSDRDETDLTATMLAAVTLVGGVPHQVVGTVRIHEAEPATWFGSRLAVNRNCRRIIGIGTELIRLAVGTAHARGAVAFLAHVQQANVKMFKGLHWSALRTVSVHGHPHELMQADLAHYPPHPSGEIRLPRPAEASA